MPEIEIVNSPPSSVDSKSAHSCPSFQNNDSAIITNMCLINLTELKLMAIFCDDESLPYHVFSGGFHWFSVRRMYLWL